MRFYRITDTGQCIDQYIVVKNVFVIKSAFDIQDVTTDLVNDVSQFKNPIVRSVNICVCCQYMCLCVQYCTV